MVSAVGNDEVVLAAILLRTIDLIPVRDPGSKARAPDQWLSVTAWAVPSGIVPSGDSYTRRTLEKDERYLILKLGHLKLTRIHADCFLPPHEQTV